MKYVIFDLEWNQCAVESEYVLSPICLTGEIIEIGAVRLNDDFVKEDELRLFIRPQYYKKLHHQVSSLTGIRDRDLEDKGVPFPEAYRIFREWCGDEFSFMTWSMSDLPVLLENMQLHGLDCSDLPDIYDLQRIFGREIMRCNRRISLEEAIRILGEHGDTAHDALNDSNNTVLVCNHLNLDEYAGEYVTRPFVTPVDNEAYESIPQVLEAEELRLAECPFCGERLQVENWGSFSNEQYAAMGTCSEGDEYLLILEARRIGRNHIRTSRILYEMSADLWEIYSERKQG